MDALTGITTTLLGILLLGCGSTGQKTDEGSGVSSDSISNQADNQINKIKYDSVKVIKKVYVLHESGTEAKARPDFNSTTLAKYDYGTTLEVIDSNGLWYTVRDRITREFDRNGKQITSTGWEGVYVSTAVTGPFSGVKLVDSDLNLISSMTVADKTTNFDVERELKEHLSIKIVDERTFTEKANKEIDFVVYDTSGKNNSKIITLQCNKGIREYKSKPDAEEDIQNYDYIGQIPFLNKFMISGSYWESGDYKWIDKENCEETDVFNDYPHISPDKKHVISIYTNPYNTSADLELYSIANNKLTHIISLSFSRWMPTVEFGHMFWSDDGYFYATVNHVDCFWTPDGSLNNNCQYIRIQVR